MNLDLTNTTLYVIRALWEQRPLIERAKTHGATVVAVDETEDAEGLVPADESVIVSDLRDIEACYEGAVEHDVDAVVSDQCDYSLFATSYIGARLGLSTVSLEAAQRMTNKLRMRNEVGETAPQPDYKAAVTIGEAHEAASEIGFPCIVKPVDNRGGFGVSRVDEPSELDSAFFQALENSHARLVLVESFVEGVPITVDGYCIEGRHRSLAAASKNTEMGSLHPQLEITYPAEISDDDTSRVTETNNAVANALGVKMGATHAEYILTGDDVYLLEFQNRGGGVHTSAKIVPALTGFDVSRQLLADATNQRTGQEETAPKMEGAVIMRFLDFAPGYVERIENMERIKEDRNVLTLRLYFDEGEEIKDFSAFTDSHGVIIASGDNVENASQKIEECLSKVNIVYG